MKYKYLDKVLLKPVSHYFNIGPVVIVGCDGGLHILLKEKMDSYLQMDLKLPL